MKTNTIILSIHPQYIKKILSGEKQYEYRKRIPVDIRYLVVYETSPLKKIVALIEIDSIIKDSPENIWSETYKHSGISEKFFFDYFKNNQIAYAIKFRNVYQLPTPQDITRLKNITCAPQAYTYIREPIRMLCKKLDINIKEE